MTKLTTIPLLALLTILLPFKAESSAAQDHYGIQMGRGNTNIRIRVNDIEFFREENSGYTSAGLLFNQFLKKGDNTVELLIDRLYPEKEVRLELEVYRKEGETSRSLWKISGAENQSLKFPIRKTVTFTIAAFPEFQMWSPSAQKITLDEPTRQRVRQDFENIVKAMATLDFETLENYFELPHKEYRMGYGLEPRKEKVYDENLKKQLKKGFEIYKANFDELELKVMGQGRILKVSNPDGSPIAEITGKKEGGLMVMELYYAKWNNRLQIVRR